MQQQHERRTHRIHPKFLHGNLYMGFYLIGTYGHYGFLLPGDKLRINDGDFTVSHSTVHGKEYRIHITPIWDKSLT